MALKLLININELTNTDAVSVCCEDLVFVGRWWGVLQLIVSCSGLVAFCLPWWILTDLPVLLSFMHKTVICWSMKNMIKNFTLVEMMTWDMNADDAFLMHLDDKEDDLVSDPGYLPGKWNWNLQLPLNCLYVFFSKLILLFLTDYYATSC